MSARAPEGSLTGGARWACVAVLGGLGAIGVGKGLLDSQPLCQTPEPERVSINVPAQPQSLPTSQSQPLTDQREPAATLIPAETAATVVAAPESDPAPKSAESKPRDVGIQKLVNVNTASSAELQLLPGIGPVMAGRIIKDRTTNGLYRSPADLDRVKGIGPKTLEKLTPLIRFD